MSTPDPASSGQAKSNLRGMALIVTAMGAFVLNDTLTKTTSDELPIGQIIALRGIFSCLILAPFVIATTPLPTIWRMYSWPMFVRNIAEIGAVLSFLSALFRLPMGNITGVLQAVPLAITAAAAILLREPVGWRRWTASLVGLLGVMLIIRPGTSEFSPWYLAALFTVVCVVVRDISTRFIADDTPSIAITFITTLVVTAAGLAVGVTELWQWPTFEASVRLCGAAVLVLVGYYTLIEAMRHSEVSVVAPLRYTVVLWAMLLGYLVFEEVPDELTIAGSVIVITAGLYTFHRERRALRRK